MDYSPEVDHYLQELIARIRRLLGDGLVGVYAGGSLALGGFDHYLSDLDIAAVSGTQLQPATKGVTVGALRHEALPCPARGLELVLYNRAGCEKRDDRAALRAESQQLSAHEPSRRLRGTRRPSLVRDRPCDSREPRQAALRPARARALRAGAARPSARGRRGGGRLVATERRPQQRHGAQRLPGAPLRGGGVWSSKLTAGTWAVERGYEPSLVARALAARQSRDQLSAGDVEPFLERVELLIHSAR